MIRTLAGLFPFFFFFFFFFSQEKLPVNWVKTKIKRNSITLFLIELKILFFVTYWCKYLEKPAKSYHVRSQKTYLVLAYLRVLFGFV